MHPSCVAFVVWKVSFSPPVWPRSGQTERFGVRMKQHHFSRRFFLFIGMLCLLICVLTVAAPSVLALSGKIREFPITTAINSQPVGITAGPDGNLWFTEIASNNIGRISTAGVITEFAVPTANSAPALIMAGPDGNLWFTEL